MKLQDHIPSLRKVRALSQEESGGRKWRPWRNAAFWSHLIACSVWFFIQFRFTCTTDSRSSNINYYSSNKKMSHRRVFKLIWGRHFLRWSFLFLDNPTCCQPDKILSLKASQLPCDCVCVWGGVCVYLDFSWFSPSSFFSEEWTVQLFKSFLRMFLPIIKLESKNSKFCHMELPLNCK